MPLMPALPPLFEAASDGELDEAGGVDDEEGAQQTAEDAAAAQVRLEQTTQRIRRGTAEGLKPQPLVRRRYRVVG